MSAKKPQKPRTVEYNGEQVKVTWLSDTIPDRVFEVPLSDGAVLLMKISFQAPYRIEGKTDPNGKPIYGIRSPYSFALKDGTGSRTAY